MTGKERIVAACEHRAVDRIPIYHASISSRSASIVLGREAFVGGGIQRWREAVALWNGPTAHREFLDRTRQDTLDIARALDVDMVRVAYWRLNEKPTERIDHFTFLYGDLDRDWRVMRFDMETELYQTVDQNHRPPPTEADAEMEVVRLEESIADYHPGPEAFSDILMGLSVFGGDKAIPGTGVGVGTHRTEQWLELMVARPDLVSRWLDAQAELSIRNIRAQSPLNVQVMLGGGDMASNQGPFYSPRFFREFMVPRLKRVVDACHEHGKYYFFASDGNLWPIADDLFPIVDGYYEIDRRAGMDLRRLRKRYPHLTLIGNISSHTLHRGTKKDVVRETRSCLNVAKEYGSVIVGCSNLIVSQTPEDNLLAMLKTIELER